MVTSYGETKVKYLSSPLRKSILASAPIHIELPLLTFMEKEDISLDGISFARFLNDVT